jgi:hypothetical protein
VDSRQGPVKWNYLVIRYVNYCTSEPGLLVEPVYFEFLVYILTIHADRSLMILVLKT